MEVVMDSWNLDLKVYTDITSNALNTSLLPMYPALETGSYLEFDGMNTSDDSFELQETTELYKAGIIDRYEAKMNYGLEATPEDVGVYYSAPKSPVNENKI
jgi:hypothetical protein